MLLIGGVISVVSITYAVWGQHGDGSCEAQNTHFTTWTSKTPQKKRQCWDLQDIDKLENDSCKLPPAPRRRKSADRQEVIVAVLLCYPCITEANIQK